MARAKDEPVPEFLPDCQNSMDQTDDVANTETWPEDPTRIAAHTRFNAHHSLIDSANEFAFSIDFK